MTLYADAFGPVPGAVSLRHLRLVGVAAGLEITDEEWREATGGKL